MAKFPRGFRRGRATKGLRPPPPPPVYPHATLMTNCGRPGGSYCELRPIAPTSTWYAPSGVAAGTTVLNPTLKSGLLLSHGDGTTPVPALVLMPAALAAASGFTTASTVSPAAK